MRLKIFITGIYRSGTTLVSRILNNHSQLWVTYDSVHFMRFCYDRYNPISRKEKTEALVKELHTRLAKRWNMTFNIEKIMSDICTLSDLTYRGIYEIIMEALATQYKQKTDGWGEKTNVCWGQIPNFLTMFPEGKIIHILRDPRDVMCSYKKMTYEPGYAYLDSAFASFHSFMSARNYLKDFSSESYCCLKYEDLVTKPVTTIKELCDFLRLDYEDSMLDVLSFSDKTGLQIWDGESSFDKAFNEISKKPLDRWKNHDSREDLFLVELINRPVMSEFGYELSGIELQKDEWLRLYDILQGPFVNSRYNYWLRTGKGIEAYPSDPLKAF